MWADHECFVQGRRSSALYSIAGEMQTADIVPRAAGDFTLQCRTAEHVAGGMIASFHVEDDGQPLLHLSAPSLLTALLIRGEKFDVCTHTGCSVPA